MPNEAPAAGPPSREVREALARWDLGAVQETVPLVRGSSASPKFVITAEAGRFVLKRRAPGGASDPERIALAHAFIAASVRAGVPAVLPRAARSGRLFEGTADGTWELFPFVQGERWSRTAEQARAAGESLGLMHGAGLALRWHGHVPAVSFHGSLTVMEALRLAPESVLRVEPDADRAALQTACESLAQSYRHAAAHAESAGFADQDAQVVHGDFHPGNLLYHGDQVAGAIDFDAVRLEPAVLDFANGLLQFSCFRGPADRVAQWPAELDPLRLAAFCHGYVRRLDEPVRGWVDLVTPLMIEACVAEASLPIARKGRFGPVRAADMLQLVARRAAWLLRQGAQVREWLRSSLQR